MTKGHFGMSHKQQDFYEKNIGNYILLSLHSREQWIGKLISYDSQHITLQPYKGVEVNITLGILEHKLINLTTEILKCSVEVKSVTTEEDLKNYIKYLNGELKQNPPKQKSE